MMIRAGRTFLTTVILSPAFGRRVFHDELAANAAGAALRPETSGYWPKCQEIANKSDAFREILRPTSGVA